MQIAMQTLYRNNALTLGVLSYEVSNKEGALIKGECALTWEREFEDDTPPKGWVCSHAGQSPVYFYVSSYSHEVLGKGYDFEAREDVFKLIIDKAAQVLFD